MTSAAVGHPVALITGASSGIGAAVARHLAEAGCIVALNYRSNAVGAETVRKSCVDAGVDAFAIEGDVASDDDCRKMIASVLNRCGRLDYLVNNAGTTRFADARDLEALTADDFARIFAVNVTGAYLMTRAAVSALRVARGAIVNVSSHAAFSGQGSCSAYVASKGALNTLTLALARALAPEIRVNAICPGFVDTKWMASAMDARGLAEFKERSTNLAPLQMLVSPGDVADAVGWLALNAKAVTGQLIVIDAGTHLTVDNPLRKSN